MKSGKQINKEMHKWKRMDLGVYTKVQEETTF